jgi:DNA repair protein RecO (recombination protein O)
MTSLSTSAIVLRRVEYGDYDLILSFLTPESGRISAIAKSAKKSTKRFGGVLELFSILRIVCTAGRREGGLPILQEASLLRPLASIRSDINKTANASYWAEIVYAWTEEGQRQPELFRLLAFVLGQLDCGRVSPDVLSILFQFRFLILSGHQPNLSSCTRCRRSFDTFAENEFGVDLAAGGLVCRPCRAAASGPITLGKGAVKQLQWLEKEELSKAGRVRFSEHAAAECLRFLEAFLPYHLGREPKSLKFLRQIRKGG